MHGFQVELLTGAQQLHILAQGVGQSLTDEVRQRRIIQFHFCNGGLSGMTGISEMQNGLLLSVIHAPKLAAAADGPVDGVNMDPQLPFHFLAKCQGVACFAVHLVDKGKNGNMAHSAHLEQLSGLRLHAFCAVNHHHGTVCRHQRAVGILRKVLMARGVQNVDAKAVVAELHHGRSHGDTALFFDLHPVRGGRAGAFALHLTGLCNRAAVKQEFFRQCCLTGIGV